MPHRWIALVIFLLLIVISIPLARVLVTPSAPPEQVHLQTLELDEQHRVEILGRLMRNNAQAFYYLPVKEDEPLGEPRFFASLPFGFPELVFTAHMPDESPLAAIAAEPDPAGVLAIIDFEAENAWPSQADSASVEQYQQQGREWFERFSEADPQGDWRFVEAHSTRALQELIDLGYEPYAWPEDAPVSPLYHQD